MPGVPSATRGLAPLAVVVACLACTPTPLGKPLDDPDLKALLRPIEASDDGYLRLGDDGKVYYSAGLGKSLTRDRYLEELKDRGALIQAAGSSPHNPVQRIEGYQFTVVQEASLDPYTIRYKSAWDAPENGGSPLSYSSPISIEGRRLNVRLGAGAAKPWTTHVVVPTHSVAAREAPVPIPDGSIVLDVRDQRWSAQGTQPTGVLVDVLVRQPPERVFEFYKKQLGSYVPLSMSAERVVMAPGSQRASWLAPLVTYLSVSVQPTLFADDNVAVWDSRTTRFDALPGGLFQARTLVHRPADVFHYWIALDFRPLALR